MASASPTTERNDALDAVASSARSVFRTAATLIGIVDGSGALNITPQDQALVAELLAELVAVRRPELRAALDRARPWLDKLSEVEVPFIGDSAPSACQGALEMLDYFAALVAHDLGLVDGGSVYSAKLPADADALAATLVEHWQLQSLPVWLRSKDYRPTLIARLKQLAELAWREHTHSAIADPFVPTPLQRAILGALNGRALKLVPLAVIVSKGDTKRLYKPGGLKELRGCKVVVLKRGVGFYRPDAPPPTSLQSA